MSESENRAAEFVFSLRSPYAWLAAQCVLPRLPPGLEVRWTPFFPLPEFPNFPPLLEAKLRYLVRDVARLTRHYGLTLRFPSRDDVDWTIPHSAFLRAREEGKGEAFALAVWGARFSRGEHVEEAPVLARAAEEAGLDPEPVLAASQDPAARKALTEQVRSDFEGRGIFGVPTLILPGGTRFWGHDRIDWAIREGLIP